MLRIEKNNRIFTLLYERYNLDLETKVEISRATIELPEKITADIIKFIQGREHSAPISYILDDDIPKYEPDLDVVLIYRNDDKTNNETFGYDIRDLKDLSKVKYERAVNNK